MGGRRPPRNTLYSLRVSESCRTAEVVGYYSSSCLWSWCCFVWLCAYVCGAFVFECVSFLSQSISVFLSPHIVCSCLLSFIYILFISFVYSLLQFSFLFSSFLSLIIKSFLSLLHSPHFPSLFSFFLHSSILSVLASLFHFSCFPPIFFSFLYCTFVISSPCSLSFL